MPGDFSCFLVHAVVQQGLNRVAVGQALIRVAQVEVGVQRQHADTVKPQSVNARPGDGVVAADEDGLPVGIQFIAPAREDARLYKVGAALETLLVDSWGAPLLTRAPQLAGGNR